MPGVRHVLVAVWLAYSALVIAGCGTDDRAGSRSREAGESPSPAAAAGRAASTTAGGTSTARASVPRFVHLPASQTGLQFRNPIVNDHPKAHLYATAPCGGVCIGDYDDDGLPDVFLTSQTARSRLFRQRAPWKFEDVSDQAGLLDESPWASGASFTDVNGDGRLDLYVCSHEAPNRLYINRGDGTFAEQAARWGLDFNGASVMAAFHDYDRDGDLDCYLVTYRKYPPPGVIPRPEVRNVNGRPEVQPESRELVYALQRPDGQWMFPDAGQRDRLLRNDGQRFHDVTTAAGLDANAYYHTLSAVWWDYDNDGHDDLYVSNDFWDPDFLYRNNGNGTFTNVTAQTLPHTPWFSMGADAGDIDNDGRLDLLASDMSATTHLQQKTLMGAMGAITWFSEVARPPQYMRNALYLNTGTHRFAEIAYLSRLASTDWTWSVKFGDLDNDGLLDLYFTNGTVRSVMDSDLDQQIAALAERLHPGRPLAELSLDEHSRLAKAKWDLLARSPPRPQADLAFRNRGNLQFERAAAWGLEEVSISFGAALGDLDRDGDLDLVVNRTDGEAAVFRNDAAPGRGVLLKLVGRQSNRLGLGARVTAQTGAGQIFRQLKLASGYQSADEPLVHLGLGAETAIGRLTIDWPSGRRQVVSGLAAGKLHTIHEDGIAAPRQAHPKSSAWFAPLDVLPQFKHAEQPFDDYERQPLLPHSHSQLGPGLAWGDADGDGDDDLFVGGAKDSPGELLLRGPQGFKSSSQEAFVLDSGYEDMAALWLDADADGDLDLYAASGSSEFAPDSPALRDRLYLNDGRGVFHHAHDALPDLRIFTGAVAAGDCDGDGDLDLFVGGRMIPGRYPHAPRSALLRNDGGRFSDATGQLAPDLEQIGMVTSAVWSDANGDGRLDLLLTLEWGPVRLLLNTREGLLIDRTQEAALAEGLGWWNSIAPADLNGDGRMDYVVGNFGLNTKYHASARRPAVLYYGDMDGSGQLQLVEAEYEHERLVPIRGRSCSSRAMPFIAEKFPTYRSFGLAALDEIYSRERLMSAARLSATRLESGVLINSGDRDRVRFEFRPLPALAQIAPVFGIAVSDFNADGHTDVFLAQNFFSPQVETGRMDGGLGLLLTGDGKGNLKPMPPHASGIVIAGDAKAATVCDLDDDHRPDLLVSRNNDSLAAFGNRQSNQRWLAVKLDGPPGNPQAVGAQVTARYAGGAQRAEEVQAGGGYLSQSTSLMYFGGPPHQPVREIAVRWPNGAVTTRRVAPGDAILRIKHPSEFHD